MLKFKAKNINNIIATEAKEPKVETSEKLKLVLQQEKFTVIMTDYLMNKIRYLCEKIPTREWSGVVFYNVHGSIEDIENLKITAIDVYPEDIGNATYTEFDFSPDLTNYMASNPELLDAHMGLMHSHNSMNVFFSGTDNDTLVELAPFFTRFLSIIVNNKLEVKAALSFEADTEEIGIKDFEFTDFKNNKIKVSKEFKIRNKVVYKYDANIIANTTYVDEEFLGIVDNLLKDHSKHSYKAKDNKIPKATTNPDPTIPWYADQIKTWYGMERNNFIDNENIQTLENVDTSQLELDFEQDLDMEDYWNIPIEQIVSAILSCKTYNYDENLGEYNNYLNASKLFTINALTYDKFTHRFQAMVKAILEEFNVSLKNELNVLTDVASVLEGFFEDNQIEYIHGIPQFWIIDALDEYTYRDR